MFNYEMVKQQVEKILVEAKNNALAGSDSIMVQFSDNLEKTSESLRKLEPTATDKDIAAGAVGSAYLAGYADAIDFLIGKAREAVQNSGAGVQAFGKISAQA